VSENGEQIDFFPLEQIDGESKQFRISVNVYKSDTGHEGMGQFTIRKEEFGGGIDYLSQETTDAIIQQINDACNRFYSSVQMGVMDLDIGGEFMPVSNDGFIRGTGIIAPVKGGGFQLGTSEIEFEIDTVAYDMRIFNLINSTTGDTIISDYKG